MRKHPFFKSLLSTILSLTFLAVVAVVSLTFSNFHSPHVNQAHAQSAGGILSGWGWSDTTGWISFSSVTDGSAYNYAVSVDSAGNMSGYAWSDNIGWISFNPSDVAGCPTGSCAPIMNLTTGQVTGWARALAAVGRSDGWDGWIQLSGTNHTSPDTSGNSGVTFNPASNLVTGYAWGEDAVGNVVGWINFGAATFPGQSAPGLLLGIPVQHTLIVQPEGNGVGTVVSTSDGGTSINCGSTCTANYNYGQSVTLTESSSAPTTFVGWSNGCTGTGPTCTVVMTSDAIVGATFTQPAPTAPVITGPATVLANAVNSYNLVSTDPNGHNLKYNIVFDPGTATCVNATPSITVPSSGYVGSGVSQSFTKSWPSDGAETICAQAVNTLGAVSGWTSYSIEVEPPSIYYQEF